MTVMASNIARFVGQRVVLNSAKNVERSLRGTRRQRGRKRDSSFVMHAGCRLRIRQNLRKRRQQKRQNVKEILRM